MSKTTVVTIKGCALIPMKIGTNSKLLIPIINIELIFCKNFLKLIYQLMDQILWKH
jgi:hypothetical protein